MRYAGVIGGVFSAMSFALGEDVDGVEEKKKTPCNIYVGGADPMVPAERVRKSHQRL